MTSPFRFITGRSLRDLVWRPALHNHAALVFLSHTAIAAKALLSEV
ncbi:MAG: hypothetical protein AAF999_16180 [Pseudomonadota bacterium]